MARLRDPRAFTILEVLVAITILSLGLLGTAVLSTGIFRGNYFSREMTTAMTLAQDKLEEIEQLGYRGISATDTTIPEGYNSIAGFPNFRRVTDIAVGNPSVDMKMVTVTVFWQSDARSVAAITYLAE